MTIFELEPRIMFDAAGVATTEAATAVSHDSSDAHILPTQIRTVEPLLNSGKKEVAFIDSSVSGYQTLIDGVGAGIEIELIDGTKDGLAQITAWAQTHTGYDAIHILSHGSSGSVHLGSMTLDKANISTYSTELGIIGNSLTTEGDILLYGCNVASDSTGVEFITKLSQLTSADIASSDDITGASDKGGDWILEKDTSDIETETLKLLDFRETLADVTISTSADPDNQTLGANDIGQSFTATKTGVLKSIGVVSNDNDDGNDWTLKIYAGAGTAGTLLHTQTGASMPNTITTLSNYSFYDININATVNITSGSQYTFIFTPAATTDLMVITGSDYAGGTAVSNDFDASGYDMVFRVVQGDAVPTFTSGATASFVENGTGTVYTATATASSGGGTVSYSLTGGADQAKFAINSTTGALTFVSSPNYESPTDSGANNVYDVIITATDSNGSSTNNLAVTVTNVNEAPSFTSGATASFAENGTGTVYTATSSDPDSGATASYSIVGGADQAKFAINSSSGVLTFVSSPNYESPTDSDANNTYVVNLQVTDGTNTATQAVTVTVSNVNETPTLTTVSTLTGATEDTAYTISYADLVAAANESDPENGTISFRIEAVSGGTLTKGGSAVVAGTTTLSTGESLVWTPASNANGATVNAFTVKAYDGTSYSTTAVQVAVNVTSLNDAPSGANHTATTNEDTAYTFAASDFGFTDTADSNTLNRVKITTLPSVGTLSVTGGGTLSAGDFVSVADITGGNLIFTPVANASGAGYASFTFQVEDNGGTANGGVNLDPTPRTMTINVTAVNDAPTVANAISDQTASVGSAFSYVVPSNTFSDVDTGDTLTYTATKADGNALPSWLSFNASTRTFSGTATGGDTGTLSIKVTATDNGTGTLSTFDTFDIVVSANPTVAISIDDDTLHAGQTGTVTFTFSEAPTGFDDSDITISGGTLSALSATDATHYTATFTPTATTQNLTGSILVAAAAFTGSGNNSLASNTLTITGDTLVPLASSTPDMSSGTDSGTSNTDNITNDTTPTFTGTGEVGATVSLYDTDGTTLLGTTTADGSGNWSITSSVLSEGVHTISAKQTDAIGNLSNVSSTLGITIDVTAPSAPATLDMGSGSDSGISNTDNITNDTTPTVTGTGEAGTTITLYDTDGTTILGTTTVDGFGNWSITSSTLTDGIHTISAKQTDTAGNVSNASSTLSVTIDATVPSAPSTPDMSSGTDSGASNTDNMTNDATPTFTGTAEAGATVNLYDTDGTTILGTTTADGSGNWNITASTLTDGTHTISAKQTDTAGNISVASSDLSVTILANAPTITSGTTVQIDDDSGAYHVIYATTISDSRLVIYTLKNTGDFTHFSINHATGVVTLIDNPDYQQKPTYSFTVFVRDSLGNIREKDVTLQVRHQEQGVIPPPQTPLAPPPPSAPLPPKSDTVQEATVISNTIKAIDTPSVSPVTSALVSLNSATFIPPKGTDKIAVPDSVQKATELAVTNTGRLVIERAGQSEITKNGAIEVTSTRSDSAYIDITVRDNSVQTGEARYSMSLGNGANTPSWITIDKNTGKITGVPPKGTDHITVKVTITTNGTTKTVDMDIKINSSKSASLEGTFSRQLEMLSEREYNSQQLIHILNNQYTTGA